MTNLTISVDDEALRRARIRALEEGTSVSAVLGEYLRTFAGLRRTQNQAIREILEISERSNSGSGGRKWSRDELYDR